MLKKNLLRIAALAIGCILLFTACAGNPPKENTDQTPSQTDVQSEENESESPSEVMESEPFEETLPSEAETPEATKAPENPIAKINGGADEVGIYAVVVKLTKAAADKGVVEMVYKGAKGSPQENSIVNTFRIEYYKNDSGTFEIHTFSDGEVYANQHNKEEVKVTNEFGANLRAGDVTITYTPDGGEMVEIFKEDADYFRSGT